jgi:bifunctional non-homologous end joining protein LigD
MLTQQIDQPCTTPEAPLSLELRTSINNRLAANRRRCVIKKHRATRLHYDFRFEFEGILLSWVLEDGPSDRAGERRVAVRVEDHDLEYMISERVIPPGKYGAGPVMLWDEGTLILLPGYEDIRECLRNGCLRFTLECHKLKGNWTLRRRSKGCPGGRGEIWELIKDDDEFARGEGEPDILIEAPNSVSTGRTLEEIERDGNNRKGRRGPEAGLFDI